MAFYQNHVLPHLIHLSMRHGRLAGYRSRLISAAEGRVLEIGIGSGLNLPYYGARAERVIGLDPSPKLLAMARERTRLSVAPVELIKSSAETIPLDDWSIDTVVTTWTLCSIPDATRALGEMLRVMKPGGRLLFVEHGRAPDPGVRWWQDKLTPAWKSLSGGCQLNRAIVQLLDNAGFRIERLDTGYMAGPKPMTFMYEGSARPP